jgi:hypothetical protein
MYTDSSIEPIQTAYDRLSTLYGTIIIVNRIIVSHAEILKRYEKSYVPKSINRVDRRSKRELRVISLQVSNNRHFQQYAKQIQVHRFVISVG